MVTVLFSLGTDSKAHSHAASPSSGKPMGHWQKCMVGKGTGDRKVRVQQRNIGDEDRSPEGAETGPDREE